MSKQRYYVLLIFCLAFASHVNATHNRAGEITYKWIGPGIYTYQIKLTTYTNIGGSNLADRCEDTLYFNGTRVVVMRSNGPCNGSCSPACEGVSLSGGTIKLNEYVINHTYPGPGHYKISMEDPNRNAGVINIPNSVNQVFYVESYLVIPFFGNGKNSSPILTFPPIDNGCVGQCFYHNPGAYDVDGDSLSYELTTCRGHLGVTCPGYTHPATGGGGVFRVDSLTGTLEWCTPQAQGEYNMAMLIKEWRKDDDGTYFMVGYIERDMQVDVGSCNNNGPQILLNSQNDYPVAGSVVAKTIVANDLNSDILTMEAKGEPFTVALPASFSTNSGVPPVNGNFSWQTATTHVRRMPYQVTVKVIDNDPVIKLVGFKTFNVKVIPDSPFDLSTNPYTDHIILKWKKPISYTTSGPNPFLRYNIYRNDSAYTWIYAIHETAPPPYTGFTYIGSSNTSITDTTFFDYNSGNAFVPGQHYTYVVLAEYTDGATSHISNPSVNQIYVGIKEHSLRNEDVQTFPNPANEDLMIVFTQPESEWLTIELMDITGRTIKTLTARENITKQNTIHFNLENINSGIYLLKITGIHNATITKKIIKQ